MTSRQIIKLDKESGIAVGTNLYMKVDKIDFPLVVTIVGAKDDEFLFVTPPESFDKVKSKLSRDNIIIAEYLFEEKVFDFQTRFIETIFDPVTLLVLEFPEEVRKHERRAVKRNSCLIPVRAQLLNSSREGVIRDISNMGCRCNFFIAGEHNIPLHSIENITLTCQFPYDKDEIKIEGEVRNYQMSGHILSFGIMFTDLSDKLKKTLDDYIFSIQDFS